MPRKIKPYTKTEEKPWTTVAVRPAIGEELASVARSQGKYVGTVVFEALKEKYPDRFTDEMLEA
jgi:hypothetical protein